MDLNDNKSNIKMALVLSLTLGLAPFYPEPHIWGKLKWVWGGAHGMTGIDYFDLIMHGFPWVLLLILLGRKVTNILQTKIKDSD